MIGFYGLSEEDVPLVGLPPYGAEAGAVEETNLDVLPYFSNTLIMSYEVHILKKAKKDIDKAPVFVRAKFVNLVRDLSDFGPVLPRWPHYSKLGAVTHHCHLADKWVACWRNESGTLLVEVYYAGSRESATY